MKLAITSQGTELNSAVDPRFGRARFFIVVDTDTDQASAYDNAHNLNAAQGAGIQAAQNLVNLGVDAVITSNVGPKAFATLQAGRVKVYTGAENTVAEAVEQFKAGRLQQVEQANIKEHWA